MGDRMATTALTASGQPAPPSVVEGSIAGLELHEAGGLTQPPHRRTGWVKSLWVVLAVAALAAVSGVVALALPNLGGSAEILKQLDLLWKIAVAIAAAAGTVLGWLVKHESDVDLANMKIEADSNLARLKAKSDAELAKFKVDSDVKLTAFKATIDAANRIIERGEALSDKAVETIVKGHVDLAVQEVLLSQKQANDRALENFKAELELEYRRKTLSLEGDSKREQALKDSQPPALERLKAAVESVHATFRSLTIAGPGLNKEELNKRIEAAIVAKTALDAARRDVEKAFQILPAGFTKLAKRYSDLLLKIIKLVNDAPNADDLSEEDLLVARRDYERIVEPAMRRCGAHLRTISRYLIVSIEHALNRKSFVAQRVGKERNRLARVLMWYERKEGRLRSSASAGHVQVTSGSGATQSGQPRLGAL
jgi:hypothetical protein